MTFALGQESTSKVLKVLSGFWFALEKYELVLGWGTTSNMLKVLSSFSYFAFCIGVNTGLGDHFQSAQGAEQALTFLKDLCVFMLELSPQPAPWLPTPKPKPIIVAHEKLQKDLS